MNTDPKKAGQAEFHLPLHEDVAFEPQDVRSNPIFKFLAALGITVVASYFLTLFIYRGLTNYWLGTHTPAPPSREGMAPTLPPQPRLQGMPGSMSDPQQDLRTILKADTDANNELSWVDQKAGIARIPVKDAMELIVEKGLPTPPTMPAEKK
jgi:hypothetical protein